eukprot:s1285_g15.t1
MKPQHKKTCAAGPGVGFASQPSIAPAATKVVSMHLNLASWPSKLAEAFVAAQGTSKVDVLWNVQVNDKKLEPCGMSLYSKKRLPVSAGGSRL